MILDDGGDLTAVMHEQHKDKMAGVKGLSEETPPRSPPLRDGERRLVDGAGLQRQRFGDQVEIRQSLWLPESLVDGIKRATDVMLAGKVAVVAGYGDVGKGSAASLRGQGARVLVTEIDPICALQASMEGYEVVTMDEAAPIGDVFVTTTGNIDVITLDHMREMKDRAIVSNMVTSIPKFRSNPCGTTNGTT